MWRAKDKRERQTQSLSQAKQRRPALLMALEPRMVFDGAAVATVHAVHTANIGLTDHHVGTLSPIANRNTLPIDLQRLIPSALRPLEATQSSAAAGSAPASGPAVIFIDSRVTDAQSLLQGVAAGTEVVYLNSNQDGLQQMSAYLAQHPEVGSVEIIAHGSDGELLLGDTNLTTANINSFAQTLGAIGSNLRQGADILVYACDTAADATGVAFVDTLAQLTGHNIAASSSVIGVNGGWDLDVTTGDISARPTLSASAEAGYQYDLQTIQVTTTANSGAGSLRAAITTADGQSGDVIYFSTSGTSVGVTSVTLASELPNITSSMTIESDANGDGASAAQVTIGLSATPAANAAVLTITSGTVNLNGLTIDANYDSGVLKVTGGTVKLSNSTIEKGLLAGNGGGYGIGAGQNAMGAGIFVSGSGTILNISNVTIGNNAATGGGGGSSNGTGNNYYGGGGGVSGVGGGSGGGYSSATAGASGGGSVGGAGTGGKGGYVNPLYKGSGGAASAGGSGGTGNSFAAAGGNGATAGIVGGGGGASGIDGSSSTGAAGGSAAGGMYVGDGAKVYMANATFSHNYGAGGGGGGSYSNTGGSGGNAGGAVLVGTGSILDYQSSTVTFTGNVGAAGAGGHTVSGHGGTAGANGNTSGSGGSNSSIWNLGVAGDVNSSYNPPPKVSAAFVGVSGSSGTGGDYKIGDTVTATWNNSASGDNNSTTVTGVTFDFSQFGGGSAVVAVDVSNVWTATYTITSGSIDAGNRNVAVTATDSAGSTTTTGTSNVTVDNKQPVVTSPYISLSGGTGTSGAFKLGDTVTATWNDTGTGDNNTDTINAGGVTMNFSQFGGGSAVVATNSGGVWTATYTITSGAIDTSAAHVAVTATDHAGNATTQSGSAVTVDDIAPVVTSPNISLSGGTGTGGAFKTGDTVTATWNDSGTGDNNTDTINAGGVTMNFSQFGGGSAVVATDVSNVWTATYTIASGSIDTATAHVAVTATDHVGNAATTSSAAAAVDDIAPIVTAPNISLSGGTGTSGAFKIGDTVTATWNDSGTGDNNTDTINAGGVTLNFAQFGGGSAVVATNSAGVWTATYTIASGSIDTSTAHVAVTATDAVGNATTTSSSAVTVDNEQPVVTAGNISLSGATGVGGAFKVGDTVTATWDNTAAGDNNTDTINAGGVTLNFSQFGGGSAVTATNSSGVWTATYTITAGAIDTANAHVAVTATDHVGNAATTSSAAAAVDDIAPIVTAPNISLSGGTGTSGAFKIGDTVTATWNDSGTGDNNTDTINAGGVTLNFSQFGGGSAVVATNSGGIWTATYTITSGSIDTSTAHVAVTATDVVGNATTTSSSAVTVDNEQPVVSAGNISLSGATGTGGAFKIGHTVTATWDDSAAGDNNTDTISAGGVTMNFAQFGGGSAVTAINSSGVWTATYTITSGSIDTANAHVAVTATDHVGNATTTSSDAAAVDDIAPIVTASNISLSGGTGTGGAFKIGDTVTATWNDSGTGDNNTDTINAGGVTMDFSQFGGGSAVVATNSSGVWAATYTLTSGAIDTATAHVAVTATDHVGNATTTSSAAVTVDDIQPLVTAGNISLSGATGTGGVFKIGDTVTATWDDSGAGDNNTDTINAGGVTMDFSQFGGGSAVVATNSSGVWTATYTITSGSVDTATAHVAVTATDHVGNASTTSSSAVAVDDIQPIVTSPNISLSGGTGTGGAFKIGDTVTATWDNSGTGDNNTDTINAGGVTMNFAQFGGGSAVTATNSSGVWTATYTIAAGAVDTASAHVAVTATDHVGNATTTSGAAVTVDDIAPVVTVPNISLSGGTGTGGAFKIGDTVTATWNDSGTGDNNTDTINAGGVVMNFSQFGGGSAVTAINSSGVWTATYTITSGVIDTATAHVAVTATDHVGNATTTSSSAVTVDDIRPVVTSGNISLSGGTGTGGGFKVGDTVTATWNDSGTGDNNTDTINAGGVTMDFSQFGGGSAVTATNSAGIWTATYTITSGAIDMATAHVAVTATDHVGNATTTSGAAVTVDDIAPIVTSPNISLSGGTGIGGAFKIGDTVTATWNDSGTGDNNTDTINAGGVTINFSQFGGGSAVTATNSGGVWTATYTITSGAIDTATAHVAVTATDSVGNATTTSSGAVTVDDIQPVVTVDNISLSGGTGTGGVFKIGDTVTATWNDSASGDNNTDTINAGGVTMDFSQFGGGSAVTATNSGGVWTATYTITSGAVDTATAHVAVTATDHVGNATTTSSGAVAVDDIQPIVTASNISLSGGTGTGGAFKIGDTVTATWNDSGTGDNNTDTINAGGVSVDFSQFGGGSAVTAINSGGVWTATYMITSGSIDTGTAHVAVTATDSVGNATTRSGGAVTVDDIQPVVTSPNISVSGGTGTGGAFKIGDTVTATWNDSATGDNNTDTISAGGVTMNFAQFGGGSAVTATNSGGVWTATYTITSGAIDTATAHVAVTATDHVGNATTTSSGAVTVDDLQPVVTSPNISVSGGTGTGGAFKIGDTVTATWNDSGTGDNNTDTVNAGGVTMDFSQFGGGSAVTATNSAGVWTATYTITSGAIDTASAHVAVTATDHVGNATTTSSSAVTADDIQPVVTSPNISLSGATGTGGAFKTGDTVTATWNDSGTGDNNTDTINAGSVTMDFSQFGGGSAVTATNSGGMWTATYTITSGAIDTTTAHVAVTATDHVGNVTTTSSSAFTVDNTPVTVVSITPSGSTPNTGGSESFTVTFSTAVTGVTASDFTVANSGVTYADILSPPTTTDGVHWTVVVEGVNGYGTLSLGMTSSGVAADQYGNVVSLPGGGFTAATEPSNDTGYTVHGTPVLTAGSGNSGFTEANPYSGNSPVTIDSGITLTPGNSSTMTQAVISFTGATYQAGQDVLSLGSGSYGNIAGSFDTTTGTLTLTSAGNTATAAQWQAALEAVSYTDTAASPGTTSRSFAFVLTDSNGLSNTPVTETMTVTHTDQSPVVTPSGGSTGYLANAAATPIDGSITITEADGTALSSVVVTIGSGAQSGDALSFISNAGTMGNIAAGAYNSTTHTLTLTSAGSSASLAQWDAALEAVEFATSGADGNRTINFVAANAGSETSNTASKTVDVGLSSPTLTPGAGNSGFTETDPYTANTPVTIDSGITLTPGNSSTMTSATVSFAGSTYHSGQDVLSLGNGSYGNITGSFDATTGTLTLASSGNTATVAQWQAALDAIAYDDTAALPDTTPRSLNFTIIDSNSLSSNAITETVAVTHIDQSPVVTTSSGSIDYVGGASAATIDSSIAVTDSDNGTQSSATVSITTGFHSGDTLAFNNTNATLYGNIGASYNAATGVLTLSSSGATATDAQWANALSTITFSAAATVSAGNRTISFTINDGTKSSATATDTVDVIDVITPPIVTTDSGSAAFVAGDNVTSTPVAVDNGGGFSVTDAGSATLQSATVSITGNFHSGEDVLAFTNTSSTNYGDVSASYNATSGVLTLTSTGGATLAQWNNVLEAVTYTDTAITPNDATRTISFSVTDGNGNASNTATRTVTVADTDQTPTLSTTSGIQGYVAGLTPIVVDSGIMVGDRDNTTLASATVTISSGFRPGDQLSFTRANSAQDGNITASYDATTGVLTLNSSGATATLTQWQAALDAVQFSTLATASLGNRTLSFVVNDGTESSATATRTVALSAQAFAPPVVENSQETLGSGAQDPVLVIAHESSSPVVLQELSSQPVSGGTTAVQTAFFSSASLDGELLGLSDSGSRTESGVDVPTWLQPTSPGWLAQIPQTTLTEQFDVASGDTFSIALVSSSTPADGATPDANDVHQADGRPLPAWMHYDAATGVLSGVAPKGDRHEIRLVVSSRDSTGQITHREIVIDFGGRTTSGTPDGSRPLHQSSLSAPNPAAHSKPSLAEQFSRQRAALHVSLHPHAPFRRSA